MPETKEETKNGAEAATEKPTEEKGKGQKKGKSKLLMIIALEILAVAAAFVFVNFYLKPWEAGGQKVSEAVEETRKPGPILAIEDLVVNPAGSMGKRYLSASIGVEAADQKGLLFLEGRIPAIRDILIGILSAQTVEQLSTPQTKEAIRQRILEKVRTMADPVEINNVYLIDYVIQ
ncbi:MAG: hypothetical protein GF315_03875 [candidate division Zixibacteria bacterium]|nr:hypothetical protein [candidate division Zixibacteria bacterium]